MKTCALSKVWLSSSLFSCSVCLGATKLRKRDRGRRTESEQPARKPSGGEGEARGTPPLLWRSSHAPTRCVGDGRLEESCCSFRGSQGCWSWGGEWRCPPAAGRRVSDSMVSSDASSPTLARDVAPGEVKSSPSIMEGRREKETAISFRRGGLGAGTGCKQSTRAHTENL